jgi:hypothetical protein
MEPTEDTITVASSVTEELNPSLAYIYLKVSIEKEGNFLPLKDQERFCKYQAPMLI